MNWRIACWRRDRVFHGVAPTGSLRRLAGRLRRIGLAPWGERGLAQRIGENACSCQHECLHANGLDSGATLTRMRRSRRARGPLIVHRARSRQARIPGDPGAPRPRSCRFSVAAEKARELGPSGDAPTVAYLLDVTAEAVDLLTEFPDVTIGGARDVRESGAAGGEGSRGCNRQSCSRCWTWSRRRAICGARFCGCRTSRRDFRTCSSSPITWPSCRISRPTSAAPSVRAATSSTRPVPELGRIRRDVRVAHSRLMERLNALVSGGKYASVLQDSIVTTRDGRYVVPVRADARAQLPGRRPRHLGERPDALRRAARDRRAEQPLAGAAARRAARDRPHPRRAQRQDRRPSRGDRELGRGDRRHRPGHGQGAPRLRHARAPARAVVRRGVETRTVMPRHRISLRRARHPLLDPADGRADRRRSRRGLPGPAHHRAEHGRQDGRAEDDRPADADGADRAVHSGRRHVGRLGLSRRSSSTSATSRASRRVCRPSPGTSEPSSRCCGR